MLKYDIRTGVKKIKTKTATSLSIGILGIAGLGSSLAFIPALTHAATNVVYNSIPNPSAGNYPSQAFEATSTSEFGGQVQLAGAAANPTVTVQMSSWGCQNGTWFNHDCSTTSGATFTEPVTLNIYTVGAGNSVGTLVATSTQTFQIPYRPSADPVHCTGAQSGEWYSTADNTCYNGFATPITYNLTGTIPQSAIVTVAYNTSDYGATPYGDNTACHATSAGCGYDSLNVALTGPVTVGSQPDPTDAYLNSSWSGAYCPANQTTGTLRLDSGCWAGFQPNIKIEVNIPSKDDCKNNGWQTMTDANHKHFKNQGDCVSYFATGGKNQANGH